MIWCTCLLWRHGNPVYNRYGRSAKDCAVSGDNMAKKVNRKATETMRIAFDTLALINKVAANLAVIKKRKVSQDEVVWTALTNTFPEETEQLRQLKARRPNGKNVGGADDEE